MKTRGRTSVASLTALSVTGDPPRLTPPKSLSTEEAELFNEIVNACSPRHFVQSDIWLVASYARATAMAQRAFASDDKEALAAWERAVRTQMALAGRLRLSPNSRIDPKTVGRLKPRGPHPWEDED
jgi:hypothetical protein